MGKKYFYSPISEDRLCSPPSLFSG